ncbi:DUF3606 domain-containing protein [Chelatococcus sp. GCM10030263]|uniref:DUF3606 domain-containing protein n=1 Tax=Chelatococcus sp. GCM10030263 TaxID=3273387 RepID=UPI00362271D9
MDDSRDKCGADNRSKVAGDQDYKVSYFAKQHGIMTQEAKSLIEKFGNDRAKLDATAAEMKRGRS